MSESLGGLRRKIDGARELGSVVRTMKALAASSIGQYEKAVLSLNDYYRTVQLGLVACLRQPRTEYLLEEEARPDAGPTAPSFSVPTRDLSARSTMSWRRTPRQRSRQRPARKMSGRSGAASKRAWLKSACPRPGPSPYQIRSAQSRRLSGEFLSRSTSIGERADWAKSISFTIVQNPNRI